MVRGMKSRPPEGLRGSDGPLIVCNAGDGGHDVPINRPPEAGAQVRILPGAPNKSGPLTRCRHATSLVCPLRGVHFIARFIAHAVAPRILFVPTGMGDANVAMEHSSARARRDDNRDRAGYMELRTRSV